MSALKLLVVEDSRFLQAFYRDLLDDPRLSGRFEQSIADSAESAMKTLSGQSPDVVILDWILPGRDGMTVLDAIRSDSRTKSTMVFVVSCLGSHDREAQALRCGADDYLAKPFEREELVSRLLTLVRKLDPDGRIEETFKLDDLELEMPLGRLWIGSKRIDLHHKEAELMRIFLKRPDAIHSAEYLWSATWGYPCADFNGKLEIAIASLREKLGNCWGRRLDRIPDRGYILYRPQ